MENREFRTIIRIGESPIRINYNEKILLVGSCFTENIGQKLEQYKFDTHLNPSGIIYNPVSVCNTIQKALEGGKFGKDDLLYYDEKWLSLAHHGRFSGHDKDEVLEKINNELSKSGKYLREGKFLIITLGTSWVYTYKPTGLIVANCHKIPSVQFRKSLLSVNDIVQVFNAIIPKLQELNPGLTTLFTISPVRHWNDGPVNNQLSKSILHVAMHELLNKFNKVLYFPAYEIMMDDLRDYRFYADDMLHPSQLAVDYIWEKFKDAYIEAEAFPVMAKLDKLASAINHRPFDSRSEAYQKFVVNQLKDVLQLKENYPFLDLNDEINFFQGNAGN